MTIQQYLSNINTLYKSGIAREHAYRPDFQFFIKSILQDIEVTNEPARVQCGAPDFVLTRKDIPVGYIEAKDIGIDLNSKSLKEQFDRYKAGLTNLIFTDYIDFHFYKDGVFVTKIAIASLQFPSTGGVPEGRGGTNGAEIVPIPENFDQFINLIQNFVQTVTQTIKSPTKLAQMMAGKAKLMANVIEQSLDYDDGNGTKSSIKSQMLSFQQMLIHDIDNQSFSDIYAQTIAYGMFAARYHDPTLPTFSRQEAATLIPKSNPFLRKLFQDIAGYDLDTRLLWIVEELVAIFLASDVADIMKNFGKSTKQEDPVVHFYETFLGEYNPALRKARGVWYTPQPVVNFIVRAVDDILKTEFGLKDGLADTSKIASEKFPSIGGVPKGRGGKELHRVQILDPATGTGTFLAETIKHIHKKFEGQQGIWSQYVTNDLIPRLNGFELLMASYAMAHLKMDILLTETGYSPATPPFGHPSRGGELAAQRFNIFLTNSLEEAHPDSQTLFSSWLSDEADQANAIKRDAPVMVVMGNPPYSVSSTNKSKWIEGLTADYKKDMNERNIQPLSDDYIKFIRFGQHFIDKNGSGILAYISNNSFIDGIIHRQMRKHLLESFDKIYILDLHGNAKKKEVCPDGTVDQNVFDIMQGVSINLFVKFPSSGGVPEGRGGSLAQVFHYDLFGKRDFKYNFLTENNIKSLQWNELEFTEPNYFFVPKDFGEQVEYEKGFKIDELFRLNSSGIKTHHDNELVSFDKFSTEFNSVYLYRPFDYRFIDYDLKKVERHRFEVMKHILNKENVSLITSKQFGGGKHFICYLSNQLQDISSQPFAAYYNFPLYLYPDSGSQQDLLSATTAVRTPNLNMAIVDKMAEQLQIAFVAEKVCSYDKRTTPPFGHPSKGGESAADSSSSNHTKGGEFAPINILDYIYGVLHSPTYREKYKEFLKIDFPRVPYPADLTTFQKLSNLGSQLRKLHLLESEVIDKLITQYPENGNNMVEKIRYENSFTTEINSPYENSPPLEGCPKGGVVDITNQTEVVDNTNKTLKINDTIIKQNPILSLPYNENLKQRAKELRQAKNLSEVLFWMQVTKGGFHKIDFDRQRVIGNYIVDFYVKRLGLVIEIDGSSHDDKQEYDQVREDYLISLGLKVYRIAVYDVFNHMAMVMSGLEDYIVEHYGEVPLRIETTEEPLRDSIIEEPPHPSGTPPKEGNELPTHRGTIILKERNLGKVFINDIQYFANVPEAAWNFYIGGYQPAQKWLKDRKGRTLTYDDILHYQKIIVALTETDRIMKEIDLIEI